MTKKLKLHLACGPHIVDGWVNIDILKEKGIVVHDLREPLPYKDSHVDAIFHEHFIEHLSKTEAEAFLKDCYRVLKPGGVMRIGWPDLKKLINAYVFKKRTYRDYVLPHIPNHRFGENWDEIFSDCLFSWEHKYAYTVNHLKTVLADVGFRNVKVKHYKDSNYGIALDFRNDPATTYLEMIKK